MFPPVPHLVTRNAHQRGKAPALIHDDRMTTHAALADRVARLAGALNQRGVRGGERVAILAGNSDRYIETLLAVMWAGGIAAPLNTRWSTEDVTSTLRHIDPVVTVVDTAHRDLVGSAFPPHSVVLLDGDASRRSAHEALVAEGPWLGLQESNGEDIALLLFTSGTTGFPKAAMLSHGAVLSAALAMRAVGCGSVGTYLHVAPLFHLAGIQLMVSHLMGGTGPQVVLPAFDAGQALAAIERHGVSNTLMVPTMLRIMLDDPARTSHDLRSLSRIHYGGAAMPSALLDDARAALGDIEFVQGYGMTETMLTTTLPPEAHDADARRRGVATSLGRPHPTVEVVIRDSEDNEMGAGRVGELTVRGPTTMAGYYRDDAATAATMRGGWVHTGDAGYVDAEGYLHLVDRLKDIIVTGGENVASARVEDVLSTHPGVSLAAVIGLPDDVWGERVHALVVPAPGCAPTGDELMVFCRQHLAGFMCPRSIELRHELPISAAGKVLKTTLRQELRTSHGQLPQRRSSDVRIRGRGQEDPWTSR